MRKGRAGRASGWGWRVPEVETRLLAAEAALAPIKTVPNWKKG